MEYLCCLLMPILQTQTHANTYNSTVHRVGQSCSSEPLVNLLLSVNNTLTLSFETTRMRMRVCADLRLGGYWSTGISRHITIQRNSTTLENVAYAAWTATFPPESTSTTYQGQRSSAVVLPSVFLGKTNHRTTPLHDRDDYDDDGAVPLEQFPLRWTRWAHTNPHPHCPQRIATGCVGRWILFRYPRFMSSSSFETRL